MILKPIKLYKGMSLLSFLLTLTLFSGLFLTINEWLGYQRKSAVEIYQRFQAVQIAENQKQRQFLGLDCQRSVSQNDVQFSVQCSADKVKVSYPRGEINL
ncbi:DUF5374 domain-containing protein [Glaesserella sp.]|uniref:DUF5374 domain-containing protein n=1 Tax=Glaesserella sp. TaxID=2094731 RepID=UPI0035A1313D